MEFCLGLYRARTGRYKVGKSRLPGKIEELLKKMFEDDHLKEALKIRHAIGAWIRQETAFSMDDTHKRFVDLCRQQMLT